MQTINLNRRKFETKINGEPAYLEISDLAKRADAAIIGKHGETAVLAVVVMGKEDQNSDYFPLTVDYEEKFYAVGKIMGSRYVRREGRPSDEAVLAARLIDRSIRPLFDHRLRRPVQVTVTILAYDGVHEPEEISMLAVSAALSVSRIPWQGPIAGIELKGETGGEPYKAFFAGPKGRINMIELEAKEMQEDFAKNLFQTAQNEINRLIEFQESIVKQEGKEKEEISFPEPSVELKAEVKKFTLAKEKEIFSNSSIETLKKELLAKLSETLKAEDSDLALADWLFEQEVESLVKEKVIKEKVRVDGRKIDEVRPLYSEVGLFNRNHGSALFIRGDTQIFAVTTLDSPSAAKIIETIETSGSKRFLLDYNFPQYSTGEVGRSRGPGRREIGHGALAHKALKPFIPPKEEFPYTIRIVAETLSSNGSSSMATTCAGCLSLMDAGVPIKKHIAGIAIGLMHQDDDRWLTLTDIQGPEDHYGDMDLKIAGTEEGINAIQMDVKIKGINEKIFESGLIQAKAARLKIIEAMKKTLPAARSELSPYAPTILNLKVPVEKIGEIIGPGGKTINGIISAAGDDVNIDIEEDGSVFITATDRQKAATAVKMINEIIKEYQIGEIVEGTVIKIMDFGAIVDLGGGQTGMIHISELSDEYVKEVRDVVKEGDKVRVKIIKMEPGKIGLTLKGVEGGSQN